MNKFFQAMHYQDEGLTAIREVWQKSSVEMIELFLDVLKQEPEEFRKCMRDLPDSWIELVRDCAVCGIRQCILNIAEENPGESS